MLVVSIGGSPSLTSRSAALLAYAQRWLEERGVEVNGFQIRDFPAEDLLRARFDSPAVRAFSGRGALGARGGRAGPGCGGAEGSVRRA